MIIITSLFWRTFFGKEMHNIPDLIKNKIDLFLQLLKDNKINIEKTYLFGSYANGTYNEWSDIDLAIISDDFTGNTYQDKINLIDIIYSSGHDISPIPYKNKDFENSLFAQNEILKKGILIK